MNEVGWGRHYYYPRALIHVDGDSFFAACEVARNPSLRGKPVVTGAERGIVSAATYEAKALGINRGIRLADVKKICPEAIIVASDYELYTLYSLRMYEIMRRYTPAVEEYGIDECFGDLTGLRRTFHMSYEDIARKIKADLYRELDITFSVGLSCTKVLAKVGSKYQKPDGFTAIPLIGKDTFLANTEIGKIWGIGPNTTAFLQNHGIRTALDFTNKNEDWVKKYLNKPIEEIWRELNGESVMDLVTEAKHTYYSIQKTRTFSPPSKEAGFLYSQLSKNVEGACAKARTHGLTATGFSFFLKSQEFRYRGADVKLSGPSNAPHEILHAMEPHFLKVFRAGTFYRASGVTLTGLHEAKEVQLDLFTDPEKTAGIARVFERVDVLTERFGRHAIYLASSMKAIGAGRVAASGRGIGSVSRTRAGALFKGRERQKIFPLPFLGEVG
ncbi:MAG: nucleotidyltransferase/DNA polymerase protein [Parcubacteria group bacterium]|nr:nucleotidyltransferase/DNA polymerase protein [Parcubacteria group bacterium]